MSQRTANPDFQLSRKPDPTIARSMVYHRWHVILVV